MAELSKDALIFGLGYLRGPKSKLSFGGEGANMEITPRARAALDELIAAGYAEPAKPNDQIVGREYFQGVAKEPELGPLAQAAGLHPFSEERRWASFSKIVQPEPDDSGFTM